ncbi:MAG: DNA gyrase subunit A [Candidatus Euphemobacter frigidus]|nr:DNA gyrase subunit A [Candidatus Euphemobacter frigidus]MDP8276428.1 DNA gyrase subunit A [Candidatus Euphemobacter frigidus]
MYARNEKLISCDIKDEMRESYLNYAMSVIVSRALPDARDGLKPSQRRILVAMNDLGLGPRSRYRKCAKIAGDTSGNYHPHGEAIVYPTLVRMAQDFNLRYPMVDGQGNFGSIDGDPPAAMRYTEARLTPLAMEMLHDLKKDTVDFVPNYDETLEEPVVLPAKFPNLLCNGAAGIAVGMATNIPPHNLNEVAAAIKMCIDNPEVGLDELIKVIPGPDFPTGGIITGIEDIRRAYTTGRGRIKLRGRIGVEPLKGGRESIIITEIPYVVNKTKLLEDIAALVNQKKITGISDLRDESDREGMRIVIELKRGEVARVIINQLYKKTQLQVTFGIILLSLDRKRPRVMDLKSTLRCFIDHRKEVIIRRTRFELAGAERRAHILEGFKIALKNIDEVIKIIKGSSDRDEAKKKLIKRFKLSEIQTDAILDLRLYRLTGLESKKIDAEYKELIKLIAHLQSILASEKKVLEMIKADLDELSEKYGDERRTEIVPDEGELEIEDLIADETALITISHRGYIKRVPVTTYRSQRRGGKGVAGMETRDEDFVEHLFTASTHDYLLFFTESGRVHWLKVYQIPPASRIAKGRAITNLLEISNEENIADLARVRDFNPDQFIMLATSKGIIKKSSLLDYSRPRSGGIIAATVDPGDRVIEAILTNGSDELLLVTSGGKSIRFKETDVRSVGRTARGVKGIRLGKGDKVVAMEKVEEDYTLLVVSENGYGKRTDFDQYHAQKRGGGGVITMRTGARNGALVGAASVRAGDELMLISTEGQMIRMPVDQIRVIGRATKGVRLINLDQDDKLVSLAKVAEDEHLEENGEEKSLPLH